MPATRMGPARMKSLRACTSEFFGTLLLVLFGAGSVAYASVVRMASPESLLVFAAVFGITVATVIVFFGPSSGAHINPAISLAHLIAGRLDRRLIVFYIFFQILGGLVAGAVLSMLFTASPSTSFLGSTSGICPGAIGDIHSCDCRLIRLVGENEDCLPGLNNRTNSVHADPIDWPIDWCLIESCA